MKKALYTPAMVIAVLIGLVPVLAQGALRNQPIQEEERAALFPTLKMINHGREVAEMACANCHGMDGLSNNEGEPHLAGQRTVYLYRVQKTNHAREVTDRINTRGDFLNNESLLSVAAYYASQTPASKPEAPHTTEPENIPDEDPFLSIRDAMAKCIKCHGESGNAKGSGISNLTAQDPEYFATSMTSYIDGSRNHKLMKRLVSKLDEMTIKDMGVFYAVQEPVQSETRGEGDVNVGRRLSQGCQSCHGDDGNAKKASMPTLAGQDAKYFIKAMKHYKDGKRLHQKMFEAVKKLSEQDMTDLASFYAAQQPVRRDVRSPLKSTDWIKRCERCHGIDGNSSDPRFPMLAGQDETYLRNVLQDYSSQKRENSTMHAMSESLSTMDIERIAAYFAAQQPRAAVYIQLPCGDDQKK